MPVTNAFWYLPPLPACSIDCKSDCLVLTATRELLSIEPNGLKPDIAAPNLPNLYPGRSSLSISLIKPEYFLDCSAGITASPGESIAGTMSPAPFGPGTDRTPELYFLVPARPPTGPLATAPVLNLACAAIALLYAVVRESMLAFSRVNVWISCECVWLRDAATAAASSCS